MKGPAAPIRIVLVDDHRSMLAGLEWVINSRQPEMMVVGTATTREQAIQVCAAVTPDLVLVDLDLGGDDGLDLIRLFAKREKPLSFVLTGGRDPMVHQQAVIAGARGVLSKEASPETIIKAIRRVLAGELWLDRVTTQQVLSTLSRRAARCGPLEPAVDVLTERQKEIVTVLVTDCGLPTKTIAARLGISEHTLRNHLASIYEKLGVANRIELYQFAQKYGLTRSIGVS